MITKKNKKNGFALLEMLAATIILSGIIYFFVSFTQNTSQIVNKEIAGKHIAILINTILEKTFDKNTCLPDKTSGALSKCLVVASDFASALAAEGLDTTTSTLKIASVKNYNNEALLTLTFTGNFMETDGSIYSQQILENLSPEIRTHLSPNLYIDPALYKNKVYNSFLSYIVSTDATTITFNLFFMK